MQKLFDEVIYSILQNGDEYAVSLDVEGDDLPFYIVKNNKIIREVYPCDDEFKDILTNWKPIYSLYA